MAVLRFALRRMRMLAVLVGALCLALIGTSAKAQQCAGDCDGDKSVAINELITCVNIALGSADLGTCSSCDPNGDNMVGINELILAVNAALDASICMGGGGNCPLGPGLYTVTSVSGGTLTVSTFQPFPFPNGGTVKEEVSDANMPDCIHSVVVPFPGGFQSPVFCVPALGFTVEVKQTSCGIGQLDSNGGSDYTVTEIGDTSDTSDICNIPQVGACGPQSEDSSVRVDVTVGDGTPDTCTRCSTSGKPCQTAEDCGAGGGSCDNHGTANGIIAIPVVTTTWIEHSSGDLCGTIDPSTGQPNGADGTFDPGPDPVHDDFLVVRFPQILDFTTDTNTTKWQDLDGDGCVIAGRGPAAGLTNTGACLDLDAKTISTAASGPIGSSGSPTFDLTYTTRLVNSFSGPEAPSGATCDNPPAINFNGLAHQCIVAQE
jgi:hypothetical protein